MTNGRDGKAALIVSYDVDDVMVVEFTRVRCFRGGLLWRCLVEEDHRY